MRRGGHCVPFGGHFVDALVWTLPGQELQSRLYLWLWWMPFDVFVDIR
uniref:MIP01791p n=1 Tax=Drosophila melanogaster TaxID=7227 RepID=B8A3Y9_DROME|nr:MIP01791p [Drosophila melanogaster]